MPHVKTFCSVDILHVAFDQPYIQSMLLEVCASADRPLPFLIAGLGQPLHEKELLPLVARTLPPLYPAQSLDSNCQC